MDDHDSAVIEKVTRAIKQAFGKALNAKPLHGHTSDWYTDESAGSIDLSELAQAAIAALKAEGWKSPEEVQDAIHDAMDEG